MIYLGKLGNREGKAEWVANGARQIVLRIRLSRRLNQEQEVSKVQVHWNESEGRYRAMGSMESWLEKLFDCKAAVAAGLSR